MPGCSCRVTQVSQSTERSNVYTLTGNVCNLQTDRGDYYVHCLCNDYYITGSDLSLHRLRSRSGDKMLPHAPPSQPHQALRKHWRTRQRFATLHRMMTSGLFSFDQLSSLLFTRVAQPFEKRQQWNLRIARYHGNNDVRVMMGVLKRTTHMHTHTHAYRLWATCTNQLMKVTSESPASDRFMQK